MFETLADRQPELRPSVTRCRWPYRPPLDHRCEVGGGSAGWTMDSGKTWFCTEHLPPGDLRRRVCRD